MLKQESAIFKVNPKAVQDLGFTSFFGELLLF